MEKSKIISFSKRLATTCVLVPTVVWCVLSGAPQIYLLALLGAVLLSWEWAEMMQTKKASVYALTYFFVSSVAIVFQSMWLESLIIAIGLLFAFIKTKEEKHRFLTILGVPYIAIGLGAIVALYVTKGPQLLLWYMCVVWAVDIGGYVFGCTIKGPKLAPKISPHKTWAGFFGGMLLSVGVSYAFCWLVEAQSVARTYALIAVVLTVFAQIGDLIESAIKRHLNIKDSSNIIPGHGGIFDRVDGLIFAAPFAYLIFDNLSIFLE